EVHAACCALIEERLARLPAPGEEDLLVNAIVEEAENDPSLFEVGVLAARFGLGERALQRLTARRLGLTPSWLIRRRRLHEAADGLRSGEDLAELAARRGYSDQSHFTHDVRSATGAEPDGPPLERDRAWNASWSGQSLPGSAVAMAGCT